MKRLLTYSLLFLLFSCGLANESAKPKGFFLIKEFGKYGYINSKGQTVIKCQFDYAEPFREGFAGVYIDSLWGFIDTTGKIVIEPKFIGVSQFYDGLSNVIIQKATIYQHAFIRKDGSIAFVTPYEYVGMFNCGRATVTIKDEVCVIDKSGKIVFNTHFPLDGGMFQDGILKVWSQDSTKYFDTDGKVIAAFPEMGNGDFSEGLAKVRLGDKRFYIDKKGKPKINLKHNELTYFNFSEGLARAVIGGVDPISGFIDTTGNIVIPIIYHDLYDFKEGLAAYRDKGSWGFIDMKGKVTIKPQFEDVEYFGFTNGLCKVNQNRQSGYINRKGEFVWKEQVGLEYTKLDLSKWELDTLKINRPFNGGKYAGWYNYPRKQKFPDLNSLTLRIDITDLTVYDDNYFANKLYLINASKDIINIPAQDGGIKIVQQAKNKKGEWQDIEKYYDSWCGNSYNTLKLSPDEFQIFATPIFKGEFKTQLRFKLELGKQIIYSNIFNGQINYGQLVNPEGKDKTGIAVWAN